MRDRASPQDQFVEDAAPVHVPGTGISLRISEGSMEKMRLCMRAAQLRAQHKTYRQIAVALGLPTPAMAQTAVKQGLSIMPQEDLQDLHRMQVLQLDRVGRKLWGVVENPPPLVSQGKVMWKDEEAGIPFPDEAVRVQALRELRQLLADIRKFRGIDAPKRSVSVLAEIPVADIQAHLAELREKLAEELGEGAGDILGAIPGLAFPGGSG
jgi:hypothetical protein